MLLRMGNRTGNGNPRGLIRQDPTNQMSYVTENPATDEETLALALVPLGVATAVSLVALHVGMWSVSSFTKAVSLGVATAASVMALRIIMLSISLLIKATSLGFMVTLLCAFAAAEALEYFYVRWQYQAALSSVTAVARQRATGAAVAA